MKRRQSLSLSLEDSGKKNQRLTVLIYLSAVEGALVRQLCCPLHLEKCLEVLPAHQASTASALH